LTMWVVSRKKPIGANEINLTAFAFAFWHGLLQLTG